MSYSNTVNAALKSGEFSPKNGRIDAKGAFGWVSIRRGYPLTAAEYAALVEKFGQQVCDACGLASNEAAVAAVEEAKAREREAMLKKEDELFKRSPSRAREWDGETTLGTNIRHGFAD